MQFSSTTNKTISTEIIVNNMQSGIMTLSLMITTRPIRSRSIKRVTTWS